MLPTFRIGSLKSSQVLVSEQYGRVGRVGKGSNRRQAA